MHMKERLANEYASLETERLLLRRVTLADAQDMFSYTGDSSVTEFIQIHNETLADVKRGIEDYFLADPIGKYGIELKREKKLIGTIDLRLNEAIEAAEIGYVLNKDYQHNGYMSEAVQKMFWLAFDVLGLQSVYSSCVLQNTASERLMQRNGMKREGVQRMRYKMKGKLWDMVIYSILQTEYVEHLK